jgi:hypothetical protein
MRLVLWPLIAVLSCAFAASGGAAPFFFSTGDPDGRMAMGSRVPDPGRIGIETADDFVTTAPLTNITGATFTGLIPLGLSLSSITEVNIDLYHVFPLDSDTNRPPNVPTRVNSPSDIEFAGRAAGAGGLSFAPVILSPDFTAANSVLNGINPFPNQTTGGEGPVTGQEVQFDINFLTPFSLTADHYFFVPTVRLSEGDFFWLSAPKPIVPPGTPFSPDLQAWMRDQDLEPDWLRVGTDIVGGSPAPNFNAAFTLSGETLQPVPEPASVMLLAGGLGVVGLAGVLRRRSGRI